MTTATKPRRGAPALKAEPTPTLELHVARSALDDPTPPSHYSRRKGRVFVAGWTAAGNGDESVAAPAAPAWAHEVWMEGYDAFHAWLQQHRVRACDRQEVDRG